MFADTRLHEACRFALTCGQAKALVAAADQAGFERFPNSPSARAVQEIKRKLAASELLGLGVVGLSLSVGEATAFVHELEGTWVDAKGFDNARVYWALVVRSIQRKAKDARFNRLVQQLRVA